MVEFLSIVMPIISFLSLVGLEAKLVDSQSGVSVDCKEAIIFKVL